MKKFTKLALPILAIAVSCISLTAKAAFQTVTLIGFNIDVIANGTCSSALSTSGPLDAGTYDLVAADWLLTSGSTPLSYGLSATGLYSSPLTTGLSYQLDNYNSNNALQLTSTAPSGTLAFLTPTSAAEVYVLATSGSGSATVTYTVTFTDNTTQVFSSQTIEDWFGGSPYEIGGIGRINTSNESPENQSNGPRLYRSLLTLNQANWSKSIASITVNRDASSTGVPSIFAVSINTPCAGTPTAGIAAADVTTACASTNISLSLSGNTNDAGMAYQWQSSTNGGATWSSITGATTTPYTVSGQTVATQYRVYLTCLASNLSDTSTTVSVAQNPFNVCYCNSAAGSTGDEDILNVTIGTMNNSSTCSTIGGTGSIQNEYSNYTAVTPATASQLQTVNFSVEVGTCGGNYDNAVAIYIDYNQNGLYTDAGENVYLSPSSTYGPHTETGSFTVPLAALTGNTGLRVIVSETGSPSDIGPCSYYSWGETEDYLFNITATSVCTGTPAPGNTISSVAAACSANNFTLSLQNPPTTSGINIVWESSANGTTWTPITGATNSTLITSQTTATYYHAVLTCTNTSSTGTSSALYVPMNSFINCYCTANSQYSAGYYGEISNVTLDSINNNSGNPSSSPYYTLYAPAAGTTTTLFTGFPYTLSVTSGYENITRAWIDWDQNGIFDASESYDLGSAPNYNTWTGTTSFIVPTTALPGQTKMRVRTEDEYDALGASDACATTYYGETEDYTITVAIPPACSGTPTPGATISSVDSICAGINFNLSVTTPPTTSGVTFAWQSSPDGTTWTNITGATNSIYTVSQTTNTYYRLMETCTTSSSSSTSTPKMVTMNSWINCYCTPTYSNGGGNDYVTSVTLGTLSHSVAGNTSPYYHDFSSLQPATVSIPTLVMNTTENLVLSFGSDGNQYSMAWIDFDHSGTFDTSESFTTGNSPGSNGTITIPMLIPTTALTGQTKIRIRGADDSQPSNTQACGASNSTYGEAKDYLVNISAFPLPIKLETINASNAGNTNIVNWTTSYESKGIVYNVERSIDGKNFSVIGTVKGKDMQGDYQFTDNAPANGMNYYRLNIIDIGSTEYTKTVQAFVKSDGSLVVDAFPNPTSSVVNIRIYGGEATGTLQLTDMTGKLLKSMTVASGNVVINVSDIPAGIYIIKYADNTHNTNIKINKQ